MRVGIVVIAFGIFLVGAVGIFFRPMYNWDMMGYVGLIKEQSHSAPTKIHAATYETVRSIVPDESFEELTYWNERRKIAYEDPVSFVETLSFYRIRVGYWGLGYLLSKAGINEVVAYRLIGSFFYFAVCAAVLLHLVSIVPNRLTVPDQLAVLGLAVLVALYPPLMHLGRVMVPGTMGLFGVVLGFSLIIRQYLIAGALVLLATVFVRSDLGILCVFLAVPVLFVGAGSFTRRMCAAAILCLAIPIVLLLNSAFQHPGWAKLMTSWFIETIYYPVSAETVSVSIEDYINIVLSQLHHLFQVVSLWFASVLGLAILYEVYKRGRLGEPMLWWLCAIIGYVGARFLLWPTLRERYVTFLPIVLFMILTCFYGSDRSKETKALGR